jgi:hypothetical protein
MVRKGCEPRAWSTGEIPPTSRKKREIWGTLCCCSPYFNYAAFFRLLTLRRSVALGDLLLACCARFPPSETCFLRDFSRDTSLPPLRLAGFLRQLPSSCSLLLGTGSYPGQHRDVFALDLLDMPPPLLKLRMHMQSSQESSACACSRAWRSVSTISFIG